MLGTTFARRQAFSTFLASAVLWTIALTLGSPARVLAQPPAGESRQGPAATPLDIEPALNRWRVLEPLGIGERARNPLYDPYNPNVLKGDYPLIGDKVFFAATGVLDMFLDFKRNLDFTPRIGNVFFDEHNEVGQLTGTAAFEIFHGDTVFAPKDWAIRATPIMRFRCGDRNAVDEGCGEDVRLLEGFGEVKLFEIGTTFDATSLRAGLQIFNSDFFGLIYNDVQPGVRIFSEIARNQFKVNLAGFDRLNKEKLSGLNEWKRREHQVFVASLQWDDFLVPGFNILPNVVVNIDDRVVGDTLTAYYVGFTTNGRLGRFNVNTAAYYVFGDSAQNTPSRRSEDISAGMALAQVAYPIGWVAPRLAAAWASGDHDPTDGKATGFDSVFDNVAFGGGQFSYLYGEKIQFGNATVLRGNSVFPSLRGANATSQYVNPGVIAINPGIDMVLTPKLLLELNVNYARFDHTSSLRGLAGGRHVSADIGYEGNGGITYRPFLNEQVILFLGGGVFFPGEGVRDVFGSDKAVYKAIARTVLVF
jgi:hypothetical protein